LSPSARRARLALLHYTAAPVPGGVEAIMATHARLLREAGHDVRVIAGRGDAELVPEADSRHPEVEEVAACLAGGDPAAAAFESLRDRLAGALGPLLADRDVVIAHNVLTMPFNLPLAAALIGAGRPVVAWTHDLAWVNPRYAAFRRPGWPWSILREAQAGTRYVAISGIRRDEIADTFRLPREAVALVPNGIDPAGFWGVEPATVELARRAGLGDADPLVLVPVRITRRKRIELALEAAALLVEGHPRLRIAVSGPLGPHAADNRAYVAELRQLRARLGLDGVVSFLADLPGPDGVHPVSDRAIAQLYRLADVVLLPSESEGFGLPVLEAGLSRAPLVCADIPVLREIAGTDAWTFPAAGGAEAVARALARALASRGARLRRRVLAGYGWPAVLEKIERVIEATDGRR
jgi:mannosylglucosylglycerate synthase